jgi:predicted GTPase
VSPGAFDFVRRRKWTRIRIKTATEEEIKTLGNQVKVVSKEGEIQKQVSVLQEIYKKEFESVIEKTDKPNILLLGGSGAGKSSLVNAVFGKTLAEIGEGKPVTQNYTKYSGEDSPVVIYDSRGIEHGYAQKGFSEDTRLFFEKLNSQNEKQNHIHVVWYVLDLTQARFQPFEADFCRNELKNYPIIFVLNKSDAVDTDVRNTMLKVINDFQMPNCHALFSTVANCKNFDTKSCEKCGSAKIKKRIQGESCTVMCKECSAKYVLEKTAGIKELAKTTIDVMPNLVKSVFINSVKNDSLSKEKESKEIFIKYARTASLKDATALLNMTEELVKLYGTEMISSELKQFVQSRYLKYYHDANASKKATFFLNEVFAGGSIATALYLSFGIEVCKCCIEFKNKIVEVTISEFDGEKVFKKIEKIEKEEEIKIEKDAKNEKENTDKVQSIIVEHKLESDNFFLEELIENLNINVDSEVVRNVGGSMKNYFNAMRPDLFFQRMDLSKGTKQFDPVWAPPPKPEKKK